MFTGLIETERVREWGGGAQVASVIGHALLIGGAVYGTAGAVTELRPKEIYTELPIYEAPANAGPRAQGHGRSCDGPLCFRFSMPAHIDVPPISGMPVGPEIDLAQPVFEVRGGGGSPAGGSGTCCPYFEYNMVDRPAAALPGNPRPSYPTLLRSAHIEATLSARFVVDTSGRVEPASIVFDPRVDELFEESVRRALLASRYTPAEAMGSKVPMLVRQDFAFRITP